MFIRYKFRGFICENLKKASFTVEISLLFPLIFSILILLIYIGFYMQNRTVMEVQVNDAAYRIAGIDSSKRLEEAADLQKLYLENLQNSLFSAKNCNFQVSLKTTKVQVNADCTMQIPLFANLLKGFGKTSLKITRSESVEYLNAVEFLRILKRTGIW